MWSCSAFTGAFRLGVLTALPPRVVRHQQSRSLLGLQILTNHQRRGGAFASCTDKLLAAAQASITGCKYARLARFQSRTHENKARSVEFDYTLKEVGIRLETHEHEYRGNLELLFAASQPILQHDAAKPVVTL